MGPLFFARSSVSSKSRFRQRFGFTTKATWVLREIVNHRSAKAARLLEMSDEALTN